MKLSERLEAEIGYWPRTSTLSAVLREAVELARRVEGAPVACVPEGVPGKLLYLPVSHGFSGKRVRLVPESGQEVGK